MLCIHIYIATYIQYNYAMIPDTLIVNVAAVVVGGWLHKSMHINL